MEAKELVKQMMIGDLVSANGICSKVESLRDKWTCVKLENDDGRVCWHHNDDIAPIPLPDDFLDKNGFNKGTYTASQCFIKETDHVCYSLLLENGNQVVTLDYYDGKIELEIHTQQGCLTINNVRYVHEVQQAMRIMGIKKELEL